MIDSSRTAYLNGKFMPLAEAHISPLDRGFLFADGVYEVIPVYNGQPFRMEEHLDRLENGLAALKLDVDVGRDAWRGIFQELVSRNGNGHQSIYLQVTRGAPTVRDHRFPETTVPTIFAMTNPLNPARSKGWSAVTVQDIRWNACHIKSIALLANVLARQQAVEQGFDDAIMVRDGIVTETSAGNVYVIKEGVIRTPIKDQRILPGITRDLVLELAEAHGIPVVVEDIPAKDLSDADEIWASSSTKEVVPVIRVDDRPIGEGGPGPLWERMIELYEAYKDEVCPAQGAVKLHG